MSITTNEKMVLMLIRRALFSSDEQLSSIGIKGEIDWKSISDEAFVHAISIAAIDGTDGLECEIPEEIITDWQGKSIQYIIKNEKLMSVQQELIDILGKEGISGAVIKGSAAAVCYRKPELRALGDIDFLVKEEDFERALDALEKKGFKKEHYESNPCHTELFYKGCVIEIHRYINGLPEGEMGEYIKKLYVRSLEGDLHNETLGEYTFPVTNDLCGALTLIIHTQSHILKCGLGLRHLCDWAAFVDKKLTDDLKAELEPVLEKIGLYKFYKVLTETCEKFLLSEDYVLDEDIEYSKELCDMLFLDFMFCGNFGRKEPVSLRGSVIFTRTTVVKTKNGGSIPKVKVGKNIISFIKTSWPATQKHPILIPLAFIYVPIRYLFRVILGKRKLVSPSFIPTTSKRNRLYRQLDIFKSDEGDI